MFLMVIGLLVNETTRFVMNRPCYHSDSPGLRHHCLLLCSNVNPLIQMLMHPDTGCSTKTTPLILGSPVVDELTKNHTPAMKSTPTKRLLRSSNKDITHLSHGMHSYHALFPIHAYFPYNFSYLNYIPISHLLK